jgi:hypothetical protein
MRDKTTSIIVALAAILWLAIAVSVYYVGNKPFTPEIASSLLAHLWHIAIAGLILSVCGGFGRRVVALIPGEIPAEISGLALLAIEASLGLGLLGTIVLVVGSTLGVNLWIAWLLLILLGAVSYMDIVHWWRSWGEFGDIWRRTGNLGKATAAGILLLLLSALLLSLGPPVKFDALVYHLAIPHQYLNSGRIGFLENVYWGMPELGEMLYTLGIAMGGDAAATALGWTFGVIALAGLLGYVDDLYGAGAAWAAIASLLAGFTLAVSLSWGYVDWLTLLFGTGFLLALDLWHRETGTKFLVLAGLFAGMALGTKYTAGILLLCGLAVILFHAWQVKSTVVKSALLFLTSACLAAAPWWIRNFLGTGNPFYPLLFPAGAMTPLRLDFYQNHPVHPPWFQTLLLPFYVTWRGVEGAPGYGASIGPLLLGLSGLAWIRWKRRAKNQRNAIQSAGVILLLGFIVWAVAGRLSGLLGQTRLYYALLPAWALLAGAGFSNLEDLRLPRVRLGRIGSAIVILVLWLNVLQLGSYVTGKGIVKLLLSGKSEQAYLQENLGWYLPAVQAINDLPDGARVLNLWEPRGLYCLPKCYPDEVLDRWVTAFRELQDPILVLQSWKNAGYTHILYYKLGAEFIQEDDARYRTSDWKALHEFLARLPPPTDIGGVYELYSLAP